MSHDASDTRPRPTGGPGVTRFATRGSHRLSYESSGDAAGDAVLGLHDLLGDRGELRKLADALVAGGYRVTLPDARGHGASPMVSGLEYATRELGWDAQAVLDAEGLDAARVAAIGWGAVAALALAATAPQRVVSLVLAEPYLPGLLADHGDERVRQVGKAHLDLAREAGVAVARGQTDRALDLLLDARLGDGWRDELTRPRLGAIRRAAGSLGPLLAGTVTSAVDIEAIRRTDVDTVLLVREDAPELSRWTVEALASLLPRVRMERIAAGAGAPSGSGPEWSQALVRAIRASSNLSTESG